MNPFEKIPAKLKSAAAGREHVTSKYELRQAEMERVRKEALEMRAEFVSRVLTSRTADIAGNFVPGLDIAKMTTEAAFGKTSSGENLSARQRMSYVVIAGAIGLAYALELSGMTAEALASRSAAAVLAKMEFGPEILKEIAEKAGAKHPKTAHILDKVANFTADKREKIAEVARNFKDSLTNLPDLPYAF